MTGKYERAAIEPHEVAALAQAGYEMRRYPGYDNEFTRAEYPDAKYRNGTRIVKIESAPGDINPIGTLGTVLGSIGAPGIGVGYFVR